MFSTPGDAAITFEVFAITFEDFINLNLFFTLFKF